MKINTAFKVVASSLVAFFTVSGFANIFIDVSEGYLWLVLLFGLIAAGVVLILQFIILFINGTEGRFVDRIHYFFGAKSKDYDYDDVTVVYETVNEKPTFSVHAEATSNMDGLTSMNTMFEHSKDLCVKLPDELVKSNMKISLSERQDAGKKYYRIYLGTPVSKGKKISVSYIATSPDSDSLACWAVKRKTRKLTFEIHDENNQMSDIVLKVTNAKEERMKGVRYTERHEKGLHVYVIGNPRVSWKYFVDWEYKNSKYEPKS